MTNSSSSSSSSSTTSIIEPQDKPIVMKFVIRILFGRVQGSPKSNSKQGKNLPSYRYYQV